MKENEKSIIVIIIWHYKSRISCNVIFIGITGLSVVIAYAKTISSLCEAIHSLRDASVKLINVSAA